MPITNCLKNDAGRVDEVQTKIMKQVIHDISSLLYHIFNLAFQQGIFPDILKLAKVIPIYKEEDPQIFSDYRPVFVLPMLSKVLEKPMFKRFIKYINDNILYDNQFGFFRQGYSTCMALLLL